MVLAACSQEPTEDESAAEPEDPTVELREQITELTEANEGLTERLGSLESDLAALRELPDDDPLADVNASLAGMVDRMNAIDSRIDEEEAARGEAATSANEAVSDVRGSLDSLRGEVETLQGELEELQGLYETLRDRLDRQQSGG